MKMMVLKDAKGRLIAAVDPTPVGLASVELEPGVGEELEEIEVPDNFRSELEVLDLYPSPKRARHKEE